MKGVFLEGPVVMFSVSCGGLGGFLVRLIQPPTRWRGEEEWLEGGTATGGGEAAAASAGETTAERSDATRHTPNRAHLPYLLYRDRSVDSILRSSLLCQLVKQHEGDYQRGHPSALVHIGHD